MKKLIILLALVVNGLFAQPQLGVPVPPLLTVNQMAAIPVPGINARITVSNGNSATDCTVGGGNTVVDCRYTGAIWVATGGASTFDALGSGSNVLATMTIGSGATLGPVSFGAGVVTANRVMRSDSTSLTPGALPATSCVSVSADGNSLVHLTSFACDPTAKTMTVGTAAALYPLTTGLITANRITPGGGTVSSGDGVLKSTASVPDIVSGASTNCVLVNATSTTCGIAPSVVVSTGAAGAPVFTCPTNTPTVLFTHTLSVNATPTFSCANGTPFWIKWTDTAGSHTITYGASWLRGHQPYNAVGGITVEGFIVNGSGIAESIGSYSTNYAGVPVLVSEATGNVLTFIDAAAVQVNETSAEALTNKSLGAGTTILNAIPVTAVVAPSTPSAGTGSLYVDSTSKNISVKDDAGTVKHGVQTITCSSQFISAINDAGLPTCATATGGGGGLSGSSAIDFASMVDGACIDNTFALTGVVAGGTLAPGWPTTLTAGIVGTVISSATDTVKIRLCNMSGVTIDLASLSYGVTHPTAISASGTINFSSLLDGACSTNTLSLTGAAAGTRVTEGWPAALEAGLIGRMVATATDTITIQLCNYSGATLDPASGTFSAAIF